MKLEIDNIPGQQSVEQCLNYNVLRCIYHYNKPFTNICLLRIYKFETKTVVIASQIIGAVLWDEFLIRNVIRDFKLNCQKLFWINHVGLFSNIKLAREKFFHTTFSYNGISLFSARTVELKKENEITIELVEQLIESSLEPVEYWFGLDPTLIKKFKKKRDEKIFKLLKLYLQANIEFLSSRQEIQKILPKCIPGAVFFYPNCDKKIEFIEYSEIDNGHDKLKKKVLPYISKSFPNEDIVICICTENFIPFCTIVSKKSFIQNERKKNIFLSVKNFIEYELKSYDIHDLNVDLYKINEQIEQERIKSLLKLYLEPQLDYLIVQFEKGRSIYESFFENVRGALFYYPEYNYCEFSPIEELENTCENAKKLAIPFIDRYDVETEVVVCVCFNSEQSVCGIFSKELAVL